MPLIMDQGTGNGVVGQKTLAPVAADAHAARIYGTVAWRLVPFLFICYIAAYLDRVNLSYASLTMQADLKLSDQVYGLGTGIFFLSYFLFEVPSNLILQRMGARRWIARIMITWGLISMGMVLVQGTVSFYILRFLLGAAEAGFFPGMILYLSYWFPVRRRAQMVARFMIAIAASNVIGVPISNWILSLDQMAGMAGWKWLFLVEGIPSIVLGVMVLLYLVDRPRDARFLSTEDRAWLEGELEADRVRVTSVGRHDLRAAFTELRVWWLSGIHFCIVFASYGCNFFLSKVIKSIGTMTNSQAITLSAIPYAIAGVAMIVAGWNSDRTGERRWHIAVPMLIAAVGLLGAATAQGSLTWSLVGLSLGAAGILASLPTFWALPAEFLTGVAAAGGFALINALGNLGGFAGPSVVGHLVSPLGYGDALTAMACVLVLGALLAVLFPARMRSQALPPSQSMASPRLPPEPVAP